jgi:hypothetical protein
LLLKKDESLQLLIVNVIKQANLGEVVIWNMSEKFPIKECNKLHPEHWVNVYGVVSERCEYINTCQVYQLETVLGGIVRSWFEDIVLELVNEEENQYPEEA